MVEAYKEENLAKLRKIQSQSNRCPLNSELMLSVKVVSNNGKNNPRF
jgi:hypothetical protein